MYRIIVSIQTDDLVTATASKQCLDTQTGWEQTAIGIVPILYHTHKYDDVTQEQLFKIFDVLNNCTPETRGEAPPCTKS